MKDLINKYEKKLMLVQADILSLKIPNEEMKFYKKAEQILLIEILRDLNKLNNKYMNTEKLELFAIVELFGHQRIAGKITEQTVGSSTFVRIDVPETKLQPKFTRLVNPTAIYALNPVTEDVMIGMAERITEKPIESWDIHELNKKLLALKNTDSDTDTEL